MFTNSEIQTDSLDLSSLYKNVTSSTIKINNLFADVTEYSKQNAEKQNRFISKPAAKSEVQGDSERRTASLRTFILELQTISKLLLHAQLELIIDDLRKAVLITDLLKDSINVYQSINANIHIFYKSAILIRELYIQSLEITQDYNLQRLELNNLLKFYDEYKEQESLSFSQEIKRLVIKKTLNDPFTPEDKNQGLLTRILNESNLFQKPKILEQGTQTELTTFNKQKTLINISNSDNNLDLKEELESLNAKYLGKNNPSKKHKYEINKDYAALSHQAYYILRDAKKDPNISSQEYLNLLSDALEIQKCYISILKKIGYFEHYLYKALQRSAQLFKQYYLEIKKTDLIDEAKDWLFSLTTSIQGRASNLREKRACDTIMQASCTSTDEKMRANNTAYFLMFFDDLHILKTTDDLFVTSDLTVILGILKQALKTKDWLSLAELNKMVNTSAIYLVKTFNKLFPGTTFQDNWIYAIDANINNEDLFYNLHEYLGTIYKSPFNMSLLAEALDIFHDFKLYQLEKLILTNPFLQNDKFLELNKFTIEFRRDAYRYLLQTENYNSKTHHFENLLISSEYSSQYIALLVKAKQEMQKTLEKEQTISIDLNEKESSTNSSESQITPSSTIKKKFKPKDDGWSSISEKYKLHQMFDFIPEWDLLAPEINILIEKQEFSSARYKVEEFLKKNAEIAISSPNISLVYSVFDAISKKLQIFISLTNVDFAWNTLEELNTYLAPHQYTYLRNTQIQRITTHQGQIHLLESTLLNEESDEYKNLLVTANELFTEANNKAQETGMLCYSALVLQGIENIDLTKVNQHWQQLISGNYNPISDYELVYLLDLYKDIAADQINKIIPAIDEERFSITIKNEKRFNEKFFLDTNNFQELMKALEIIESLKNICEKSSYAKRLQAHIGFTIYSQLLNVVRHKPFYHKAIEYAELIKNYAIDTYEKEEIQLTIAELNENYRKNDNSLIINSLFSRVTLKHKHIDDISKIENLENHSHKDLLNIYINMLQSIFYLKQINNFFIVLKSFFKIQLPSTTLFKIFAGNLAYKITVLYKNSSDFFTSLDKIYKDAYAEAQKNNVSTTEALEYRFKLYNYYKYFQLYSQDESNVEETFLGITNTSKGNSTKEEEHILRERQISILKSLLKTDEVKLTKSQFVKNKMPLNEKLFNQLQHIESKKYSKELAENIINFYNNAQYGIFLIGLDNLLKEKISKTNKISINYLIVETLDWGKELLLTDEFIDIFKDENDPDSVTEIQTFFYQEILALIQNRLSKTIEDAKEHKYESLEILEAFNSKIEEDLEKCIETPSIKKSI